MWREEYDNFFYSNLDSIADKLRFVKKSRNKNIETPFAGKYLDYEMLLQ